MGERKDNGRREKREYSFTDTSLSYRVVRSIAKYMDRWFLDAAVGFLFPAFGDIVTSICSLPFIYVAAFKVRSLPLTLAVVYNVVRDIVLGMFPFFIGDIIDCTNRCYVANARLITGFVEGDKSIIRDVNRKALWFAGLTVLLCCLIYLLIDWAIQLAEWTFSLVSSLF